MILIFDTETSGMVDWKAAWTAPQQPHVLQLAMLLLDKETLKEVGSFSALVQPPTDIVIDEAAFAAHGISAEDLARNGIPFANVISTFLAFAGASTELVAHNIDFDLLVMRAACHRAGASLPTGTQTRTHFCTMRAMTPICRIASPRGWKWPKLAEAYKHITGDDLEGAHDALVDVRATATLLRHLRTPVAA